MMVRQPLKKLKTPKHFSSTKKKLKHNNITKSTIADDIKEVKQHLLTDTLHLSNID